MRKGKHALLLTSILAGLTFMSGCSMGARTNATVTNGKDGVDGKDGLDGKDGKDGVDGTDGKDGSSILTGNGEPDNTLGSVGDSYIDLDTFDYYVKSKEGWSKTGNMKGSSGDTPTVTIGENGNWFVNGEDTGKKATSDATEYIVTYSLDGGTLPSGYDMMTKVKTGECILDLPTPTKANYIFEGWYIGEGENEGKFTSTTPVTSDITLTAHWKSIYSQTFTVRWLNYDGTLLATSEDVAYNTYPSYPGEENPVRESDDTYAYTFTGWSPYLTYVTEDCSYVAQFSKSIRKYSITFDMQDKGTITGSVNSGSFFDENVFTAESGTILSSRNFKISYNESAGTDFISGWYYDSELTKKVSFPLLIEKDLTLYPKWDTEDKQLSYAYDATNEGYIVRAFTNTTTSMIDTLSVPNIYDDGTNGSHPVICIRDAFRNVTNINTVILPDSITSIGEGCFANSSVQHVTLPSGITSIPKDCFYRSQLQEIDLPDTVTELGENAFYHTYLTTLTLPDGITSIPSRCFQENWSLTSIGFPENLETIGDNAFSNCSQIKSLQFPSKLKTIGNHAFGWLYSLVFLTLPESLETIDYSAFYYCQSLESVVLPTTINSMSFDVFTDCSSLTIYVDAESKPSGWDDNFAGTGPVTCYYSESDPGLKDGYYWHYVDGVPEKW